MKTFTGKELIELGYKPDKWFGDAIAYFNANPSEIPDAKIIIEKLFFKKQLYPKQKVFYPLDTPLHYESKYKEFATDKKPF